MHPNTHLLCLEAILYGSRKQPTLLFFLPFSRDNESHCLIITRKRKLFSHGHEIMKNIL